MTVQIAVVVAQTAHYYEKTGLIPVGANFFFKHTFFVMDQERTMRVPKA